MKNISKSYGNNKALDNIDLEVSAGKIFGFLGPNGAGKSTMIKILTTLIPPTSGKLSILGIDAIKFPLQVRKKIGVILQQPSYEPILTVEKSLDKYGMMWNIPKTERKKRVEMLLNDFDLIDIRKKRNTDLSIGQRRRVQVAREFMHDLEILFLDEPTIGLDIGARRQLLDHLKNKAKNGLTIFYTTHILSEVEYICDKVAIINNGKILAIDTPSGIKTKFGNTKTIKIHISTRHDKVADILSKIQGCGIWLNTGTNIIIHSEESEILLQKVLKILNEFDIQVDNLSVVPSSLEDVFLKIVGDSNVSSN
ncbi:MAG: ABC transporter ATP-binding protein [Methylococcaceae bacterium]